MTGPLELPPGEPGWLSPEVAWRREQLVLAGASVELAALIADDSSIDLHEACKVVAHCDEARSITILF